MTRGSPIPHPHGPENAEHELKVAFNGVIEASVTHFWDRKAIPGVNPYEVISLYRRAYDAHRKGERLAAERWARTAKHLARALWHEAKLAYFEPRAAELPCLDNAMEEYRLHDSGEVTADLLDSLSEDLPPGFTEMPEDMKRYLSRGRKHLSLLQAEVNPHELVRAERINAAHEYGRVVECLALAYEAEAQRRAAA